MAASQSSAVSTLIQCFAQPLEDARARHAAGERVVGAASHTVPLEIVRAAGLSPTIVRPTRTPAHFCEEFLEPGIFSPRIRRLFESALAGDLSFLSALIFARSSEQEYKTYLYFREVAREGRDGLPPLWFYDLLHSPSPHASEYGLARTRELVGALESMAGRSISTSDLDAAIAESNAARAARRRILALREGLPRLTGAEALALAGSFFLVDPLTYADLANRAADDIERRRPLHGPRLALAGAWMDDERLHAILESEGALVVAEDGGWGSRGAGHDIDCGRGPIAAIFDKYYRDGPSVRQFPPADHSWLHALHTSIEGVVFYLPPEDSIAGWTVPMERRRLDAQGIPSLVIRDDVEDPAMPDRWRERIAEFVRRVSCER